MECLYPVSIKALSLYHVMVDLKAAGRQCFTKHTKYMTALSLRSPVAYCLNRSCKCCHGLLIRDHPLLKFTDCCLCVIFQT